MGRAGGARGEGRSKCSFCDFAALRLCDVALNSPSGAPAGLLSGVLVERERLPCGLHDGHPQVVRRVHLLAHADGQGIGTCTKRPCHRPISISVLPAMAAWTAFRAMFQQYTLSDGDAGTLRI